MRVLVHYYMYIDAVVIGYGVEVEAFALKDIKVTYHRLLLI